MENLTLPQLATQSRDLITQLMEADGALTPEIEASLAELEVKVPAKIDQYVFTMKQMETQIEFLTNEAKALVDCADSLAKSLEFMQERVKFAAAEMGVSELCGNTYRFVISNSNPSVEINNEELIEKVYMKEVPATYKPDKKKIAEDLKLGLPVAGASLRHGKSLSIKVNKRVGA